MSTVDVVVPCYKYGRYLAECVRSVLEQQDVQVRLLIVDDASPDNTSEVAAQLCSDHRVSYTRHQVNRGHIATYNEGLEWASADSVLLLSADDYLLPGSLARATRLLKEHPHVGFVFGNAVELDDSKASRLIRTAALVGSRQPTRVMSGRQFIELSGASNLVPTPTAVIRTTLQHRVGGYSTDLPHAGDMEMWLRLAAHADVGVIDAEQAVYRRHSANMSNDFRWLPDLQQRELAVRRFLAEHEQLLPDMASLRLHILDCLSREAVSAASEAFNHGQFDLSGQLSEYALSVSPAIRWQTSWRKLAVKRALGFSTWRALSSMRSAFAPSTSRTPGTHA